MKKSLIVLVSVLAVGMFSSGCTDNIRARVMGGSMTVTLPQGQKLVNATWKESNLWYLTKTMNTNDVAEIYTFTEKSALGMVEGTIIFHEVK